MVEECVVDGADGKGCRRIKRRKRFHGSGEKLGSSGET